MDNKNNREEVISFRLDAKEARALNRLMDAEERPGVASNHKFARAIVVEYLAKHVKKLLVAA